ncbi:MAG: CidA/LrgA family protein [Bacilli bacterium]|nr:CidA/LrgA family protein [Bacilli bacterium]
MKIFKQIGLILLFYILGEALSHFILWILPAIFIPGPIIGMILLLIAMNYRLVKIKDVDDVGSFLTSNMAFFFIPAAVSVMEYFDILSPLIWQIGLIIIVGILVTFFGVAYSVKLAIFIQERLNERKEAHHE